MKKAIPHAKAAGTPRWEFASTYRGFGAVMVWEKHNLRLASWPDSFREMYEGRWLGPDADAEARGMF